MSLDAPSVRWVTLAIINIPVYLGLGYLFFGSWSEFWECITFWLTPDWWSFCQGAWLRDWWAELKLACFAILCLAVLYGEYRFFFGDPFQAAPPSISSVLDMPRTN